MDIYAKLKAKVSVVRLFDKMMMVDDDTVLVHVSNVFFSKLLVLCSAIHFDGSNGGEGQMKSF